MNPFILPSLHPTHLLDADDLVDTVDVGDDVEPDLGTLVLELGQEEGQQVLYGVVLAQDRRQAHDDARQCRLDVLVGVRHQLLGGNIWQKWLGMVRLSRTSAEICANCRTRIRKDNINIKRHFGMDVFEEGGGGQ